MAGNKAGLGGDPALIPEFTIGEILTLQRPVNGKNVLMQVEVLDPSAMGAPYGEGRVTLNGRLLRWFESPYADERIARQKAALDRLMAEREKVLELAVAAGVNSIVELLEP